MKYIKLNSGYDMPVLGLGTFLSLVGDETYNSVLEAIKCGYKMIDTAQNYKNEINVGDAIRDSGISRDDIFITSKLLPKRYGRENTIKAVDKSLLDLGLDYIDLYLMHWPSQNDELNIETWRALEECVRNGKIRSIGVSNFQIHHLEHLLPFTTIKPAMNQFELHPGLQADKLVKYCFNNDIMVTSYGPFMKGEIFKMEPLKKIAQEHNKTICQVVIRWGLERGIIMIPKSVHRNRIIENFNVFDFSLSDDEMEIIHNLNQGRRVYLDPDNRPGVPLKELDYFITEWE